MLVGSGDGGRVVPEGAGAGAAPVSYKYVGVRGGTRRERRLFLLLGALLLLALALAITAIALHAGYHRELSRHIAYCTDGDCIKAGAQLSQTLDRSVNPCDDFYRFACGRWAQAHPVPDKSSSSSWFSEGAAALSRAVIGTMEGNASDNDPRALHLLRDYFQSCVDKDALSERGLEPLEWALKQLGLELHPPLEAPSALALGAALGRAQRLMSLDVLLELSIIRDTNNSLRILMVSPAQPSLLSVQVKGARGAQWSRADGPTEGPLPLPDLDPFMRPPTRAISAGDLIKAELLFMTEVIQMLSAASSPAQPMTTREAARIAADIILFETQLKNMSEGPRKSLNITFYDFQKLFDDNYEHGNFSKEHLVDLETYVSALSEGLNRSLDYFNDVIVVKNPRFFSRLARSLADAGPLSTWRHLWWRAVHALLPYAPPRLLALERRFHRRVLGQRARSAATRRSACAREAKGEFSGAVAFALNRQNPIADAVSQVEEILVHVRAAFEDLVRDAAWMDADTQAKTIDKLRDIDSFIGYPQWVGDAHAVDAHLSDLKGLSPEEYMRNAVALKGRTVRHVLEGLGAASSPHHDSWESVDPIQVNAFYTRLSNSIVIPAGILQTPFFRKGHEGLNYAAIGAILGHELTHGFDSEGRHWDKYGRRSDWWSRRSAREYSARAQCFVEQYSRFRLPGRRRVDGELTLAENIADNGGVREALRAFRRRLRRRPPPPPPPALHDFTPEQLFFLGFANLWCHKASAAYEDLILKDNHSPARFRVLGSLANAPSFAHAWGCPAAARMHPKDKCIVW